MPGDSGRRAALTLQQGPSCSPEIQGAGPVLHEPQTEQLLKQPILSQNAFGGWLQTPGRKRIAWFCLGPPAPAWSPKLILEGMAFSGN